MSKSSRIRVTTGSGSLRVTMTFGLRTAMGELKRDLEGRRFAGAVELLRVPLAKGPRAAKARRAYGGEGAGAACDGGARSWTCRSRRRGGRGPARGRPGDAVRPARAALCLAEVRQG